MGYIGEGNGNPLQYSCLENPVDRGAWWAPVHGVAQSRTWLKRFSMHACIGEGNGNPLQYSCLENPVDRGAWWATVHGVAETWTWLSSSSLLASTGCAHVKQTLTLLPPVVISFFLLLNLANFWNKQSTSVVFSFSRALLMLWNYPLLHPSHFATWSSSLVFTFYTKLFAS